MRLLRFRRSCLPIWFEEDIPYELIDRREQAIRWEKVPPISLSDHPALAEECRATPMWKTETTPTSIRNVPIPGVSLK